MIANQEALLKELSSLTVAEIQYLLDKLNYDITCHQAADTVPAVSMPLTENSRVEAYQRLKKPFGAVDRPLDYKKESAGKGREKTTQWLSTPWKMSEFKPLAREDVYERR